MGTIITFDRRNSVLRGNRLRWSGAAGLLASYTVWAILVFGTEYASAGDKGDNGQRDAADAQYVVSWISAIGGISKSYSEGSTVEPKACARLLSEVPDVRRPLADELVFYRAVLSWLAGDGKSFSENANAASRRGVFTPELLLYEARLVSTNRTRRGELDEQYGLLVPASVCGRRRDEMKSALKSDFHEYIDPPPPFVPLGNVSNGLSAVAALLAQHGAPRRAIDVYLESIYANPRVGGDVGLMWVRVGELERHLGGKELALRAFLRAVYYDPSKAKEVLPRVAVLVGESKKPQDKGNSDKNLSVQLCIRIAELYRQCNLHPFALRVLSEVHIGSDIEASRHRQVIEKEWLAIVAEHTAVGGDKTMLLGVKVSDVKSWADVHILRPSDTYWKPR